MRRIIFSLILLIGLFTNGNAQSNFNEEEIIGFACYRSGSQTKPVQKVSKLIVEKKINSIIELLDSENSAEQFLAVVVCEKLLELNELTLTQDQHGKIEKLYRSRRKVSVCSGCTVQETITLKKILKKDSSVRISANYWIEQTAIKN